MDNIIHLSCSTEMRDRIVDMAKANNLSMSALLRMAVQSFLENPQISLVAEKETNDSPHGGTNAY